MKLRTTRDMIIRTATYAQAIYSGNPNDERWLCERYRLAGLIWAEVGPTDSQGLTSFSSATHIAGWLATGEHSVSEIDALYECHNLVTEFERWLAGLWG